LCFENDVVVVLVGSASAYYQHAHVNVVVTASFVAIASANAFGVAIDATTDVTLSSANTKIYLNSSSPVSDITIGSAMISSGAPTLGDTVTSQLNIGGGYNGIFKGFISEVLIFDRKITNEEASSVMSYLIKKYNLKAL
jgi:hypothetical protein